MIDAKTLPIERDATYGDNGELRWTLTRRWAPGPRVLYIGHNPSTAGHEIEDPTTWAWTHFAVNNGFGAYIAVNLYPYRAAKPKDCYKWMVDESLAVRNALACNVQMILSMAELCDMVVASWGNLPKDTEYVNDIVRLLLDAQKQRDFEAPAIYCLGKTNKGAPKHPMARGEHRIKRTQKFVVWRAL